MVATRLWANDAETGTTGNNVSTSDTASPFKFQVVTPGASNTITYVATEALIGNRSIKYLQASANQCFCGIASGASGNTEWTTAVSDFYVDMAFNASASPAANCTILRGFSDTGYTTQIFGLVYTTTRRLQVVYTPTGANVTTPTGAEVLAINTNYMIRVAYKASTGTIEVYAYPLGSFNVWTQATLTGLTGMASIGSARHGITTASSNFAMFSELRFSTGGFLARLDVVNDPPTVSLDVDIANIEPYYNMVIQAIGSDNQGNNTIVSYDIYQKSGPTVTITGTGSLRGYRTPGTIAGATLVFGATCTDDQGVVSAEDTVTHTILPVDKYWWDVSGNPQPSEVVPY